MTGDTFSSLGGTGRLISSSLGVASPSRTFSSLGEKIAIYNMVKFQVNEWLHTQYFSVINGEHANEALVPLTLDGHLEDRQVEWDDEILHSQVPLDP